MTRLQCEECGKSYIYEEDDFCPRCGAYNHPPRAGAPEPVVRRDGVNEATHEGSFLHREIHREKAQRRRLHLDQPKQPAKPRAKQVTVQAPLAGAGPQAAKQKKGALSAVVTIIIWLVIILQILAAFLD